MELSEYQRAIAETDQRPDTDLESIVVHILGLAGEAGSVAQAYKKKLRDQDAHDTWKMQLREELGDVLWYVGTVARKLDLDLDDVASANLIKTRSRWLRSDVDFLDDGYPLSEQLPRSGRYDFHMATDQDGRSTVTVLLDGSPVGDPLTDSFPIEDGYRFHDVFHLAYAVTLGWSPVTRALLKRKRKSDPHVDQNEDGGRAIVIEEGVVALAFAYGANHHNLEAISRLDQQLLDTIGLLTEPLEVGTRTAAEWEQAILIGHEMFRKLREHGGGSIEFDTATRSMVFVPHEGSPDAGSAPGDECETETPN